MAAEIVNWIFCAVFKAEEHVVFVRTLSITYAVTQRPFFVYHIDIVWTSWHSWTLVFPSIYLKLKNKSLSVVTFVTHHYSVPPDSPLWPPAVTRSRLELWCWWRPLARELFYAKISLQKWCVLFVSCEKWILLYKSAQKECYFTVTLDVLQQFDAFKYQWQRSASSSNGGENKKSLNTSPRHFNKSISPSPKKSTIFAGVCFAGNLLALSRGADFWCLK